ncbi:MAG: cytidylate kinase family protein, partial [Spirillospora sp.]
RLARAAAETQPGTQPETGPETGAAPERPPVVGTARPGRDVERMLDDNDRARTAYVKHFYGVDPADPRLYHLVIDATRLPASATADLIVGAARAF